MILTRNDANEKFYGKKVSAKELLSGAVAPPPEADPLYRALNAKFHTLGNTGASYQRNSGEDSPRSATFRSTNISAPGALKGPPPLRNGSTSSYATLSPPPPPYSQSSSSYGQPTSLRPPPPPPPSRKPKEPTAKALYDFAGEQSGDLSFREGDIITIIQKSDSQDDWWTGRIGTREGMVM